MCKYLYTTSIHPIVIKDLVKDLKGLNPLFDRCHTTFSRTNIATFNGSASNIDTSIYKTTRQDSYRIKSFNRKKIKSIKHKR